MATPLKTGPLPERLSHVEARVDHLDVSIQEMRASLDRGFASIMAKVDKAGVIKPTNTGAIVAMGGLFLALATAITRLGASGPLENLRQQGLTLTRIEGELDRRGNWIGESNARLAGIREDLKFWERRQELLDARILGLERKAPATRSDK